MFPIIEHLSQFDELLKTHPEIKLEKQIIDGVEVAIIYYTEKRPNTFDTALAKECRGMLMKK